jgi:DNA-binding GntR family transcriptional regulator
LVDAVVSRDPELAAEEARKHLHGVGQEIVSSLGVPEQLLEEKEKQLGPLVSRVL